MGEKDMTKVVGTFLGSTAMKHKWFKKIGPKLSSWDIFIYYTGMKHEWVEKI